MIRILLFWLITLGVLVGAVRCSPHETPVYYGPISVTQEFTLPNSTTTIQSQLISSHNCLILGRTLTFTLMLTNTMNYPVELANVDLKLEGVQTLYWSQTRPITPQLTLTPHTPLTLQWVWMSDPKIVMAGGDFRITPSIKYKGTDDLVLESSWSGLGLPVNKNDVGGSCVMP